VTVMKIGVNHKWCNTPRERRRFSLLWWRVMWNRGGLKVVWCHTCHICGTSVGSHNRQPDSRCWLTVCGI